MNYKTHHDLGWHQGMSNAEYHADPSLSSTSVKKLDKSVGHFLHHEQADEETSKALDVGTAAHALILEGVDGYREQVEVIDIKTRRSKTFKDFETDKVKLTVYEDSDVHQWRDAVMSYHPAVHLLEQCDRREMSGFFEMTDEYDGRVRLDAITADGSTIVDLKTTRDASPDSFAKDLFNFGYHQSAAWYLDGARRLGIEAERFVLICVEKYAPHNVAVYEIDKRAIEYGRTQNAAALQRLEEYMAMPQIVGKSYSDKIETIDLPGWAYRRGA
jgi:hypothetical protein